ncbi:Uncharacterised protein [BD1-7 clade bacterium]|uniref:ABC-2 type transporter domain-containing protein n=1 Tax=BD1-7 clade bacterium TaxID=2029982 RepID=A0A5S9PI55_9GAMM|nr:Uncharacterised protein [BD1-7 clade bacterium]
MQISSPNPLMHVSVLTRLEFTRLFTLKQGWLYLTSFIVFWLLLLRFGILSVSEFVIQNGQQGFDWVEHVGGTYFVFCLFIFPLLSIFTGANQTCSDKQRGTLRFLALRSSRDSIFFGRFIAQWLISGVLILFSLVSTVVMASVWYGGSFDALMQLSLLALQVWIAVLPFLGLMACLSIKMSSSRQATVLGALIWVLASGIIAGVSHYFPALSVLEYLVPGLQFDQLKELEGLSKFNLAYIPLLQTLVFLAIGRWLMKGAEL